MAEKKKTTTVTISVKFPIKDAEQLKKDAKKKPSFEVDELEPME